MENNRFIGDFSGKELDQEFSTRFQRIDPSSGWKGRKVVALPKALFTATIKTTYRLGCLLFSAVPYWVSNSEKKSAYRALQVRLLGRDFHEAYGYLVQFINDKAGYTHLDRSRAYKHYYNDVYENGRKEISAKSPTVDNASQDKNEFSGGVEIDNNPAKKPEKPGLTPEEKQKNRDIKNKNRAEEMRHFIRMYLSHPKDYENRLINFLRDDEPKIYNPKLKERLAFEIGQVALEKDDISVYNLAYQQASIKDKKILRKESRQRNSKRVFNEAQAKKNFAHGPWYRRGQTDGAKRAAAPHVETDAEIKAKHLKTLGLNTNATHKEVKKAFKALSIKTHPDKGGDTERYKEIVAAKEWLDNYLKPTPNKWDE